MREILVILADDDYDDVLFFEIAFKEIVERFLIWHAPDADQLFTLLDQRRPDLLVLDVHLPNRDGLDCLEEIKARRGYNSIPVIIYTASGNPKHINQARRVGADYYLNKGSSIQDISSKLRQVLSVDQEGTLVLLPNDHFVL